MSQSEDLAGKRDLGAEQESPLGTQTCSKSYPTRRGLLQAGGVGAAAALTGLPGAFGDTAVPTPVAQSPPPVTQVSLVVNGTENKLEIDPRVTLLDALREHLGLTGTKKGCDMGACGACTVLMDGRRVNACLILAVRVHGRRITTIEGMAHGEALHPLQAAFIEHDGFQCGYCTPGQIMSAAGLLAEGRPTDTASIRTWMSGNLCRCGAYDNIVAAVQQVGARRA